MYIAVIMLFMVNGYIYPGCHGFDAEVFKYYNYLDVVKEQVETRMAN